MGGRALWGLLRGFESLGAVAAEIAVTQGPICRCRLGLERKAVSHAVRLRVADGRSQLYWKVV